MASSSSSHMAASQDNTPLPSVRRCLPDAQPALATYLTSGTQVYGSVRHNTNCSCCFRKINATRLVTHQTTTSPCIQGHKAVMCCLHHPMLTPPILTSHVHTLFIPTLIFFLHHAHVFPSEKLQYTIFFFYTQSLFWNHYKFYSLQSFRLQAILHSQNTIE
jgi:hypothetical protein